MKIKSLHYYVTSQKRIYIVPYYIIYT
jgi:hypothetical protein